jgi:queuine tRNA-ribosyltransferase
MIDAAAGPRLGRLITSRGEVATPAFMPVGTRASVKTVTPGEVKGLGAQLILVNAYHLYLRPGVEVLRAAGGIHSFMGWHGPILADSGGYQVFSLAKLCSVDQSGATFRSHVDGSAHFLSPERVMEVQAAIGADIAMPLDVCVPYPCERAAARRAVELTADWARRSRTSGLPEQARFAIVQGSTYADLRREAARELVAMDFPGYALGGLSVGEPRPALYAMLETTLPELPADRPRYLMGVGAPCDLIESVARGVDLFDSVYPTRAGRHGTVLTRDGALSLRAARLIRDFRPISEGCVCPACRDFTRAYLRHLVVAGEPLGQRLATLHNLRFTLDLLADARRAIAGGEFAGWREATIERYREGKSIAAAE